MPRNKLLHEAPLKAEYCSLAYTAIELAWLQILFTDFRIPLEATPLVWCNNKPTISLVFNLVFHAHTRHVKVDHHYVCKWVLANKVCLRHVSINAQVKMARHVSMMAQVKDG